MLEKRTLENDLNLLHKNLDVEKHFNWELSIENQRIQDQHEKLWNQVDIEWIKTEVEVLETYDTHGIR